jgi:hypothetical protein
MTNQETKTYNQNINGNNETVDAFESISFSRKYILEREIYMAPEKK